MLYKNYYVYAAKARRNFVVEEIRTQELGLLLRIEVFSIPQVPVGFLTNNVETSAHSLRIEGSFNIV